MAKNKTIEISRKELKRLFIIQKVLDGSMNQEEASSLLSLSTRQIRRLMKRIMTQGDEGILHRSRGRPSNHRYPEEMRERAVSIYREKYNGLGPTSAARKLAELDNIRIHNETLRKWLIESGDWNKGMSKKTELNGNTHVNSDASILNSVMDKLLDKMEAIKAHSIGKSGRGTNARQDNIINSVLDEKIISMEKDEKKYMSTARKKYIPPEDHPWRRYRFSKYADNSK